MKNNTTSNMKIKMKSRGKFMCSSLTLVERVPVSVNLDA